MMYIYSEIERIVGGTYFKWYIGVTADPSGRKSEHGNPHNWHQWNAGNERDARAIEKHFLDKGMRGGVGGGFNPTFVYIYEI